MASIHSKRVMFKSPIKVQDKQPQCWVSPDDSNPDHLHLFKTVYIVPPYNDSTVAIQHYDLQRKTSTDSGVDNPFVPGSELSREADIIVKLIKEGKLFKDGKPIMYPTKEDPLLATTVDGQLQSANSTQQSGMNGTPKTQNQPGLVDVQHGIVVPPNDSSQLVEQVVIKKKHKCCVVQ